MNILTDAARFERDQREAAAPLPFRRDLPGNSFLRYVAAHAIAQVHRTTPEAVAKRLWSSDVVTRAAVAPAMTTVTGWAAELAAKRVADALEALGPSSAAAACMEGGLNLTFEGDGIISIPGFIASASNASFVAEGDPIPVRQLAAVPGAMNPYKIAVISVLTREMTESSNAEALIGDAFVRSAGLALDAVFFGSAAATAAQPAGIRNGIATLTASNNSDAGYAANEDITALVNAVAAVAGNGPIAIVAGAGRAAFMNSRYQRDPTNVTFYGSSAVGADIIAIALSGLASALSPSPEIETSSGATLVMDTAPGAAGTMGPERSVFQTDSMALKVRWPVTWTLRSPLAVAWTTPTWK